MKLRAGGLHKIKPASKRAKKKAVRHVIPPQQVVVARVMAGKLDPGNAIDAFQALQGMTK